MRGASYSTTALRSPVIWLSIILLFSVVGVLMNNRNIVHAAETCSVRIVTSETSFVANGDFSTGIGNSDILGHNGLNNTTPAYYYSSAGFSSQMIAAADDSDPDHFAPAPNAPNSFAVQFGSKEGFVGAGITVALRRSTAPCCTSN